MDELLPNIGARLRFGTFEVDTAARELRKRGLRLRLQEKPFQILELLLANPGEVITREALHGKLWPDVFVGFDRNLNTAINTLRHTLGDSARSPRFIETCQRRGYRFIAPVESLGDGNGKQHSGDTRPDSVAVLPFRIDAADHEAEYYGDGIAEVIVNAISQLPGVHVMARSTVARFKGHDLDPREVGRGLSVRAVVTGTLTKREDSLDLDIELVEVASGWRLWGAHYVFKPADVLSVQQEISRATIERLRSRPA